MSNWNEGYFTESTYIYGYFRELNPIYLRYCLLINGFEITDASESDNHCELGFGQGVSANIHAAANIGNYFGTDFNPAHAFHANILCNESGCNAKFFDDSFSEMLQRDDLPKFDSISLHGIWSWISPENQNHIVEFAKKFLKPGGFLYNSYNCYPGWSPAAPLRELFILHDKYAQRSNKTFERVEGALKFTEELFAKNPAYFNRVPDVKNIFDNARKHDHDYLAHEYFNRDWICMYFNEVAEMFQSAKLDFACVADFIEQKELLTIPAEAREFLNKIENPIMREQIKDYFLNRQFRKDIYIRGARRLSPVVRLNKILDTVYILMSKNPFPQTINVPLGTINLQAELSEKIYNYLAEENYRPKSFREFIQKNSTVTPMHVEELLILLCHHGIIAPCQDETAINKVAKHCRALNKYICERAKTSDEIIVLASPVTGGGFNINRQDRMFIAAIFDGKNTVDELVEYVWKFLREQGQVITLHGKVATTAEENIAGLKVLAKDFYDNRLSVIKNLQIV